jgi:drug/metabolite transporter (DMT)-like permease
LSKQEGSIAKSYLLILICVFIWALNYIVRQFLLREFSPFFLSALSLTVVSIVFMVWAYAAKALVSVTRKDLVVLFLSAIIGLIANQILLYKGLQQTTATNASLIFTLSPLMTAGLAAVFLKEHITWRMIAGCMVAIVGLFLALNMQRFSLHAGDWLMVAATFTFSCNLIFVRILSRRLSPFIITVYSFGISSLFFDPFILSLTKMNWHHSAAIWVLAIVSILIAQGLTNVMWNNGMAALGAARAAIVLNLQPLITMMLDFIILGHTVTRWQIFGITLVFIGVLFGTLQKGFFKHQEKTESISNNVMRS